MHKEISREELFEQIWSKPASQLAEQYGVSDVAISKWCKRLEIPKPPRGYWAKLKVGKSVPKKPKLKELSKKGESRISTYIPSWRESQKRPELPPAPKMIGGSLETPHRLVKCTLNALKKGRPDDRGIVRSKNKRQLDVQVTKDQIERACLIFDSLIKTLDQENMPVSLQVEKYSTSTQVDVSGTYVQLQIRERIKRTERKALKKDPFHLLGNRYDYHPTGELSLEIKDYYGIRTKWNDGKVQRIESSIPSVIQNLKLIPIIEHERELEAQEHERLRELRREEERQQLILKAKRDKILAHMKQWKKANDMRAYMTTLQKLSTDADLDEYIRIGLQYADQIDPLSRPKQLVFDEEKIKIDLPYSYR